MLPVAYQPCTCPFVAELAANSLIITLTRSNAMYSAVRQSKAMFFPVTSLVCGERTTMHTEKSFRGMHSPTLVSPVTTRHVTG